MPINRGLFISPTPEPLFLRMLVIVWMFMGVVMGMRMGMAVSMFVSVARLRLDLYDGLHGIGGSPRRLNQGFPGGGGLIGHLLPAQVANQGLALGKSLRLLLYPP